MTATVMRPDDGWCSAVAAQHGRLSITAEPGYRGRIASRRSGRYRMVAWSGGEEHVRRSSADVRADPRGAVTVVAPLRGRAFVEQAGRRCGLDADTMSLSPSDRATGFWHSAGFASLALVVPETAVSGRWATETSMTVVIGRTAGIGRVAFELVNATWSERDTMSDREFDVACDRAVDLLGLAAGNAPDAGSAHTSAVVASIRRFVEAHAAEPDLGGPSIAAALGWSQRYVQSVLHDVGTTPTELIRHVRLDRARGLLERGTDVPVARVASACGFASPGTFSTAFRRRFGARPTDVRRV